MTALATDRDTAAKDAGLLGYLVQTNVVIWKGSLVAVSADGFLIPAADTTAIRVVGVADETVNNNPGAAGAKKCRVRSGKAFLFAATSITQAMLGDLMHVVDDQTFDEATGTNGVPAGRLVQFISTTSGYIFIPDGGLRVAGISDVTYSANEQAMLADLLT